MHSGSPLQPIRFHTADCHLGLMLGSASKFCLACFSMFSEKSVAITPAKRPDLAKRLANRPLPQLRSTRTYRLHRRFETMTSPGVMCGRSSDSASAVADELQWS